MSTSNNLPIMAQARLMTYLQYSLPNLPAQAPPNAGHNTRNDSYGFQDITSVAVWQEFNVNTIINDYGALLNNARIRPNPTRPAAPHTVVSETPIAHRTTQYITPRVTEALECAFDWQRQNNQIQNRTPVTVDVGDMAHYFDGFIPDLAIYQDPWNYGSGQKPANRAPGDVKPSWNWRYGMLDGDATDQREFRQAISQVRRYMNDNRSRYGFIITNQECVAFRRDNNSCQFFVSLPVPWGAQGDQNNPRLTPLLAMWYLAMLAANDAGDRRWRLW